MVFVVPPPESANVGLESGKRPAGDLIPSWTMSTPNGELLCDVTSVHIVN